MSTRAAAAEYIAKGWAPIPIPRGEKAPNRREWQKLRIKAEEIEVFFADDANVGGLTGKPSGGRVDVDLDCPEAVAVAPLLLPPTGLRHGRPSRPGSHWWYRTNGLDGKEEYKNPDACTDEKAMIVELRGTNLQTVLPPSVYGDNEVLAWEADGEPAEVAVDELKERVADIAVAVLLGRRLSKGVRHETAGAFAGFALRHGLDEERTARLLEAVCVVAGDTEHRDRRAFVRDTARKLRDGKPATGGPRLAELVGEKTVATVAEWLGLHLVDEGDVLPLDVFGDASLAGNPSLPLEALPRVIADFAVDEAERLGVEPALVALPSIVVAAAAAHDGFALQPRAKDTAWHESPRLWFAIVGDPGSRKTPALRVALEPLRAVEAGWISEDRQARERFEVEHKVYTKALEKWANDRARNGDAGEEPQAPARPANRRRVVSDLTIEALSEVLLDNAGGVLCFVDELTSWFGSFDAYRAKGGKDRSLWLSLFQGGPTVVDRVKRGLTTLPNWGASLLGGIQEGPMRRLGGKIADDGLLARMIVAFADNPKIGVDRRPDDAAGAAYRMAIERLVALEPRYGRQVFTLAPDAHVEREVVDETARAVMQLPDTSAAFKGHLAKWSAIWARLVLTFHLVEAAAEGVEPADEVPVETARRAARLMLDFLLPNSARFYAELLGVEHLADARWIAGFILAHKLEKVTARAIGRAYNQLRGELDRIGAAMEGLHVAGWVTPIQTNGARPKWWRVNPRVHTIFARRAAEERERRERVRREIAEAARRLGVAPEHEEVRP